MTARESNLAAAVAIAAMWLMAHCINRTMDTPGDCLALCGGHVESYTTMHHEGGGITCRCVGAADAGANQ